LTDNGYEKLYPLSGLSEEDINSKLEEITRTTVQPQQKQQ